MKPMGSCSLFGASKVFSGIRDAVVLQHSVIGCHWGSLNFHCTNTHNNIKQFSTVIYEENVINGGINLAEKGIREIEELYPDVNAIFIISGCVPNIIGDDIDGLLYDIQSNKFIVHCQSPGYTGNYHSGIEKAFECLYELVCDTDKSNLPMINIIGITADDPYVGNDIVYLRKILGSKVKINCSTNDCTVDEIKNMSSSWLNVVFGYGESLAKKIEKFHNIPYVEAAYPYGVQGMVDFLELLESKLGVDFSDEIKEIEAAGENIVKKAAYYLSNLYQLPVAIVGDKSHAEGMYNFLENELGMDVVINIDNSNDYEFFENKIVQHTPVLIFGSSFEKYFSEKYNIPLVRYIYPVIDEVSLTSTGFIGVEGVGFILEKIVNTTLQLQYKESGIFSELRSLIND